MTAQQTEIDYSTAQDTHTDTALLVASDARKIADWHRFVAAVRSDAETHGNRISQNRVRVALSNEHGLMIDPPAYSGMWTRAKKGKKSGPKDQRHPALIKVIGLERCTTSRSGNNHKMLPVYAWIGGAL